MSRLLGSEDAARAWAGHVAETRSFLDATYRVGIGAQGARNIPDYDYQLGWGRTGCEKFYDRVLPVITPTEELGQYLPTIHQAIAQAVEFGHAIIITDPSGSARVVAPESGFATVDVFGTITHQEELPDGSALRSTAGVCESQGKESSDPWIETDHTAHVIFFNAGPSYPHGRSRITPAIRKSIRSASRGKMRAEIASNYRAYPHIVFSGLWEDLATNVAEGITKFRTGMSNVLGLPKDPDTGEKISIESIEAADFTPYLSLRESYACDVAAAFNIEPSELGVKSVQPSSADALAAAKEDLVVEITRWTAEIAPVIRAVIESLAPSQGVIIDDITVAFAEPATPTKASQADAFVKLASALPQLRYSPAALRWAGLPQDVIDDVVADDAALLAGLVDDDKEGEQAEDGGSALIRGDLFSD